MATPPLTGPLAVAKTVAPCVTVKATVPSFTVAVDGATLRTTASFGTERATTLGDRRLRHLLESHDQAVRRELARFHGREVKMTGDGFMAAFDGPTRAIRFAAAIMAAARGFGVEVRAGLHTGECELRGPDLSGIAVHIAARVAALAGPGEVLVSSTVKELVAGSSIGFRDRGRSTLRGVPGEWHLFEVEHGAFSRT